MFRQAREYGPVFLIPLAWGFVTAAHLGVVSSSTLFIAHVVMATLLAVFAVTGRQDMREGVLYTWWLVIVTGFVATVTGAVGFRIGSAGPLFQGVALFGWMLLPAIGFADTGRRVSERAWVYFGGATACVFGAVTYALGLLSTLPFVLVVGLVLVGAGQTLAILDAAFGYDTIDTDRGVTDGGSP
ncbi:hypothetical protein [Haloferax profundi]|uniref:DUF308 domain-containing protein n=1 Tax=Haloferax profundi TaxID=1544718 RepID=A0A0W1RLV5_9EURY|nr:hypothetical protein [Haloferax profundi]KTG14447.1 hypothetical protein AUR66_19030 [Haloferax profundi]